MGEEGHGDGVEDCGNIERGGAEEGGELFHGLEEADAF